MSSRARIAPPQQAVDAAVAAARDRFLSLGLDPHSRAARDLVGTILAAARPHLDPAGAGDAGTAVPA